MKLHSAKEYSQSVVARALTCANELATLPEVMTRIIEVSNDAKQGLNALFEIIKCDPVLSAKILKVVNSSFYGLPGQVSSVDRAITLLGLLQVKNLALATSIAGMFEAQHDARLFEAGELWRHCVAVGVAAREIALLACDQTAAADAFLSGLLHDVGLLLIRQALRGELAEVLKRLDEGKRGFLELETEVIGATHQEIGEALTAQWRFPYHLRALVGQHHSPEQLPAESRRMGAILYCAETLCCQEGLGLAWEARGQELSHARLATAGVGAEALDGLRERLSVEVEAAEAVLSSSA